MYEAVKRCPECGESNPSRATYCRNCSATLQQPTADIPATLAGSEVGDWRAYIDKNSDYYLHVFSKHEGKKWFLHINWAALFLNLYWIFYRKMFRVGFLYAALNVLYSVLVTVGLMTAYIPAQQAIRQNYEAYQPYLDYSSVELTEAAIAGEVDYFQVQEVIQAYQNEMNTLGFCYFLYALGALFVFQVAFGLLANCLYRRHIQRHIGADSGGTSVGGIFLGLGISRLIELVIAIVLLLIYSNAL